MAVDANFRRAVALDRLRTFDMRSLGMREKKRRVFDHAGALHCINRDYLGPEPLFIDDFPCYFRVSRSRFEKIMQDVGNSPFPFFKAKCPTGRPLSSIQARLMLPLKTLAYGVAMHTFCDFSRCLEILQLRRVANLILQSLSSIRMNGCAVLPRMT